MKSKVPYSKLGNTKINLKKKFNAAKYNPVLQAPIQSSEFVKLSQSRKKKAYNICALNFSNIDDQRSDYNSFALINVRKAILYKKATQNSATNFNRNRNYHSRAKSEACRPSSSSVKDFFQVSSKHIHATTPKAAKQSESTFYFKRCHTELSDRPLLKGYSKAIRVNKTQRGHSASTVKFTHNIFVPSKTPFRQMKVSPNKTVKQKNSKPLQGTGWATKQFDDQSSFQYI